MPLSQQEKMHWLEQVSSTIIALINKNYETRDSSKKGDKEFVLLADELLRGFLWIMNNLKNINSSAAAEVSNWALENSDSFDTFFQVDPFMFDTMAFEQVPWDLVSQIQKYIPQKYILYFFYAAQDLLSAKEILKADRAFRLLTLLYPQNADFWIWLGFSQQQRYLPELALISYSIASVVAPHKPHSFFYIAQCWMLLKEWDLAKINFKKCLEGIGTKLSYLQLKNKCEEFLQALSNSNTLHTPKSNIPPIVFLQEIPMNPRENINKLYLNKSREDPFNPLVLNEWKNLFGELEKKTGELAEQLNSVKKDFYHEISTFGLFEQNSITPNQINVSIPLVFYFHIGILTLSYFFGSLVAGMSISAIKKKIKSEILTNNLLKNIYSTSAILDQSQPSEEKGIGKYTYLYNPQIDAVFNQIMINPEFGTSLNSYQECNREDNRIRVSQFLPEDIVGKSILDFGCNEGGILFACRNLGATSITGIDLNSWVISQANERIATQKITDAQFYLGDMENRAFLSTLPMSDTVLLLAILDTSIFVNKTAVIANVSRFAKNTLYYEGHESPASHVQRLYELLIATDFTRFEYMGRFSGRILIRCTRNLIEKEQLPANAITSDADDFQLMEASAIYLWTDSPRNPPFSSKCKLIQFVTR